MADPNFDTEYRVGDVDNTILKKLLKNLRNVITGAAAINTNSAPAPGTPTNIKVDSADATALAANTARRRWFIQNVGTNPLIVSFGGASVALAPGTSNDDGRGGSYSDDLWRGAITVAGTGLRYNSFELV